MKFIPCEGCPCDSEHCPGTINCKTFNDYVISKYLAKAGLGK